jgi:hypothetical protein
MEFAVWAFVAILVAMNLYCAAAHGVITFGEDHQVNHEEHPWTFRLTVAMNLLAAAYLAYLGAIATGFLGS